MVLLDSPPILPVTDAAVLSNLAGGALVIVGTDHIHRAQLLDTLESLKTAGAHIFGLVINKVSRRDTGGYGYNTPYHYQTHTPQHTHTTPTPQPIPRRKLEQQQIGERIRSAL
jgi:succinoglycan biosynthesis transport protein ExoP